MKPDSLKSQITALVAKSIQTLGITGVSPQVFIPENPGHGDFSTNVCLVLSGKTKQNPMNLAGKLKEAIIQYQKDSKISLVERTEIASPGFLNVYVSEANLISHINRVLKSEKSSTFAKNTSSTAGKKVHKTGKNEANSGSVSSASKGTSQRSRSASKIRDINTADLDLEYENGIKRIVVEFTDPNPFKEFHIGHLYSNAVGESLSRILEATGHIVRRVNYFGDVGMHVAKSLWGLEKKMADDGIDLSDLENKPLKDRIKYLGAAYAIGATAYEDKSEEGDRAREEMKDLNYLIFIAAQEYLLSKENVRPQVNYRQYVDVDDTKLARVALLYTKGREWSLEYFETIYKRLGTRFEGYYPESFVGEAGARLVIDHVAKGVFEKSDGAIVYKGEAEGLHTRVFINKLGLPTYEAKELGLAPAKYEDWQYDRSIIVTGKEINEYFKVLLSVMRKVKPELAQKTTHIGHGMVRLPSGKMSSRTGKVLTGESLIDEVKQKIYDILHQNESKYTEDETEFIAEKAAVAAIKYSFLKVALPSDITFDIDKSVNFQGDSGPYLQYTYARCKSVMRKHTKTGELGQEVYSEYSFDTIKANQNITVLPEERQIMLRLVYFPDVVHEAAERLTPNILCTYLYALASEINSLYAHHEILGNPLRLAIIASGARTIWDGLHLLGIETPERM